MKKKIDVTSALDKAIGPLENGQALNVFTDFRTKARYCECHVRASIISSLGTTDTPLDPDDQADYRANRDIVENAPAYARMKSDAKNRRSFTGIVVEFKPEDESPLQVIGGQHRFSAIELALEDGVDELHSLKIYLGLTTNQRFDAQLISNTVIAISGDLLDRMHETRSGPQLRDWCQNVGLLPKDTDFADQRSRKGPITVQAARSFMLAFFKGKGVDTKDFESTETTPELLKSGADPTEWEDFKASHPKIWDDEGLIEAGKKYAELIKAQRDFYKTKKGIPIDFPEKAGNLAVMTAWAFTAGMLQKNKIRLKYHYALATIKGKDPLNAPTLANAKHKSDKESYRGLGYRTDAKERGRLVEVFSLQAEIGDSIRPATIDLGMKKFHAKQANLEVSKAKEKTE